MSRKIDRRTFFERSAVSSAGLFLGGMVAGCSVKKSEGISDYDVMAEVMRYRKIDAHEHVDLYSGGPEVQIDFADRLGIERLVVSKPVTTQTGTPDEFREANDHILKAMKLYPDRIMGQVTLNPQYLKESMEEIKRCVDQGMVGIKVYYQVKINDPLFYPIIEKSIDLKMLILMHANCQLGMAGYRMKYDTHLNPNTSLPEDFVEAAKRYPEAMLQYAHTGGGGDWEYACKSFRDYPNIYVDTSGSNNEGNMIDFALEYLGEDRLFFGTDTSYYQGVGDVLASELNEVQRKKIFFENYNAVLRKGGRDVA
ncbi:MAG: amidohydrolase family protein [Bacteroidales bacterium]|nr:amidohydrolase family protein [Bacteroidales bacterium]